MQIVVWIGPSRRVFEGEMKLRGAKKLGEGFGEYELDGHRHRFVGEIDRLRGLRFLDCRWLPGAERMREYVEIRDYLNVLGFGGQR